MTAMRIKTPLKYHFPSPDEIYFLEGVTLKPLAPDEMLQLASLPYRDDHFLQVAYSVSFPSLRHYADEGYLDLIKQLRVDSTDKTSLVSDPSIRNLIIQTNLHSPLYQVREMKWHKGSDFLGSYGMYTIHSNLGFSGELMQRVTTQIAQYSLESCNTFNRLLIGLVQPDQSWQIVLVNLGINPVNIKNGHSTISLRMRLYKPTDFIRIVTGEMIPKDVPCQELRSIAIVTGSLDHFKLSEICSEKGSSEENGHHSDMSHRVSESLP
jgi:hypothetical protein